MKKLKKFLFATHGTLATGMKSTLELLIGNTADITCLTAYVNPEDNVDEQLKVYFSEVSDEDQVIVSHRFDRGEVSIRKLFHMHRKKMYF